ncbi:MAG: hypothetical protein EOO74_09550, partial [Myxococcales bacterium]
FDTDHAAHYEATFAEPVQPIGTLMQDAAPDVVVVMLGYDDLMREGVAPEAAVEDAGELIKRARSARPDIRFVMVTNPLNWIKEVKEFNSLLVDAAKDWNTSDSAVVVARADRDFHQSAYGLIGDTWDGVHPNTPGQIKVANAVSTALAELEIGKGSRRAPDSVPNGLRSAATFKQLAVVPGKKGPVVQVRWNLPPGATAGQLWLKRAGTEMLLKYGKPEAWGVDVPGLDRGATYEFLVQAVKWDVPVEPDMNSETEQVTVTVARPR